MPVLIGAIADDFTGATDLANTLAKEGLRVIQMIGVPGNMEAIENVDCIVIALKSRTAPVNIAIDQSIEALRWLQDQGAEQIIWKYCSTFDSTDEGNIGPVADALMDQLGAEFAFICPAFPDNKRTIYQGHLFVGDQLLSESPMKDHPLTPMRQSSLIRLMQKQSQKKVGLIALDIVRAGATAIRNKSAQLQRDGFEYAVVDALTDDDLRLIGTTAANHKLITGGSGVATGLPANFKNNGSLSGSESTEIKPGAGRALVLAGSCSTATREQIKQASKIWPNKKITIEEMHSNPDLLADLIEWVNAQDHNVPVLLYASAAPQEVARNQEKYGAEVAGEIIEAVISKLAEDLVASGAVSKLIVAGGETSGAVVSALNIKSLRIGQEIAPGVPWTQARDGTELALALKSGNFGGPNFFQDALELLQ